MFTSMSIVLAFVFLFAFFHFILSYLYLPPYAGEPAGPAGRPALVRRGRQAVERVGRGREHLFARRELLAARVTVAPRQEELPRVGIPRVRKEGDAVMRAIDFTP